MNNATNADQRSSSGAGVIGSGDANAALDWLGTPDPINDATPDIELDPNTTGASNDEIVLLWAIEKLLPVGVNDGAFPNF